MAQVGGLNVQQDPRYKGNVTGPGFNLPFVDIKKSPGTGIPFVDFDFNNKPASPSGGQDQPQKAVTEPQDPNRDTQYQQTGNVLGSSTSGADAQEAAQARFEIEQGLGQYNDALGRVDNQQNVGLQNIAGDYQSAYDRLTGQRQQAQRDYTTQNTQQVQDYQSAKDNVNSNTRQLLFGTRRLLGQAGAGGGSADLYAAPLAAQTEGNNQNAVVKQTNDRNLSALMTANDDNQRQFDNSFNDLGRQRQQSEQSTRSQFEQQRADILNHIATLTGQQRIAQGGNYQQALEASRPYTQRVGGILNTIDGLAARPTGIREQAVNLNRPDLAQYGFDRGTAPTQARQDPTLQPNLAILTGYDQRRQDQQLY